LSWYSFSASHLVGTGNDHIGFCRIHQFSIFILSWLFSVA
jgi:hypothetical protein